MINSTQKIKKFKQLVTHTNYIVRDHLVYETSTLPGVTFIDIIYRLAMKYLNTTQIELRDILFKKPLITSVDFDQMLSITMILDAAHWRVTISSERTKNGQSISEGYEENMEALIYVSDHTIRTKQLDISNFIEESTNKSDVSNLYAIAKQGGIEHKEFMKTRGVVFHQEKEVLMNLHLSDLAEKHRNMFHVHPAFLDGSTLAGLSFYHQEMEQGNIQDEAPYIPFMIRRVCVYHPLPDSIYVHSVNAFSTQGNVNQDIIYTDIDIYNKEGALLVAFEQLTAKRIRHPKLITQLKERTSATHKILGTEGNEPISQINKLDLNQRDGDTMATADILTAIITYLQNELGKILHKQPAEIVVNDGFYNLGLDSTDLITMVNKLEQYLKTTLYPTLLFEYSTIKSLAEYIKENYSANFLAQEQRPKKAEAGQEKSALNNQMATFQPHWQEQPFIKITAEQKEITRLIIMLNGSAGLKDAILNHTPEQQFIAIESSQNELVECFKENFIGLLSEVQKFAKGPASILLQVLSDCSVTGKFILGYAGLLKSAFLEHPHINSQIIQIQTDASVSFSFLAEQLNKQAKCFKTGYEEIVFTENGQSRFLKKLKEVSVERENTGYFKNNSVYVITGGFGGLGYTLAQHISNLAKVTLILIGRSALSPEMELQIKSIAEKGCTVRYVSVNINNAIAVKAALDDVKKEFGSINGIIHCAGVLRDQFLLQKDPQAVHEVFDPKLKGFISLDEATKNEMLDFFVCFSSLSAITGNLAQSDYSSANAFMDILVQERQEKVDCGERYGTTLTINWPLWESGGMQISEQLANLMFETSGSAPLPSKLGLETLEALLASKMTQAVVLYGYKPKLHANYKSNFDFDSVSILDNKLEVQGSAFSNQKQEMDRDVIDKQGDIAIIGLAGRYPNSASLEEFYENLSKGLDCIGSIPMERWEGYDFSYDVEKLYKYGGFIADVDKFDPLFFNISPHQAEIMDPQARLFLEMSWKACEDAGFYNNRSEQYYASSSQRSVGVFAGVFWNHYELFGAELTQTGDTIAFGTSASSIANMVSYCLNFHGPSMAIDTMCSSALTSLHLACESIRKQECSFAIAGGVNVVTHPHKYLFLKKAKFLAEDGKCRSFGEGGTGYVPSEGVGVVLLTSLARAEKEGYPIYGVIKGSSINHSGKTSGATVPDPRAQTEVITEALKHANVHPRTISYVEAHGTGTALGDPIEIQGLTRAYEKWTSDKQYCAVGSSKSAMGHSEAAAGIAGLTKILLQFKKKEIFPSLHADTINPLIPFEHTPFYLERTLKKWEAAEIELNGEQVKPPLRAGLSSFGANGSNVHMIIEEYVVSSAGTRIPKEKVPNYFIVPLSAKNPERLQTYALDVLRFLKEGESISNVHLEEEENNLLLNELIPLVAEVTGFDSKDLDLEQDLNELNVDVVVFNKLQVLIKQKMGHQVLDIPFPTEPFNIKYLAEKLNRSNQQKTNSIHELDIFSLAYTLQVGREPMPARAAFVVKNIQELIEKLSAFAQNGQLLDGSYFGTVNSNQEIILSKDDYLPTNNQPTEQDKAKQLAVVWVKGKDIEWQSLYEEIQPKRIHLPTYPFLKERYWAATKNQLSNLSTKAANGLESMAHKEELSLMTFSEEWEIKAFPELSSSQKIETIVCFLSSEEQQAYILKEVQSNCSASTRVIYISTAETYENTSKDKYFINPKNKEEYSRLFSSLVQDKIDALWYLWPVEDSTYRKVYEPLLFLFQAIHESTISIPKITIGACYENDHERCYVESWIGFERSLKEVFRKSYIQLIFQKTAEFSNWIHSLLNAPSTGDGRTVLYKEGKSFVPVLKGLPVSAQKSLLREKGTYLITGGLGGLGILVAKYLIKKYKANLILTGRSALNYEQENKLKDLQLYGTEVVYISCNVADEQSMQKALNSVDKLAQSVKGVFHLAGIQEYTSFQNKEIDRFLEVLAPKVEGTEVIDRIFSNRSLDFICLFSSTSAILGDFGFCDYAVGNRYQHAYASCNESRGGTKIRTICWPLWRESLMGGKATEEVENYLGVTGQGYLESTRGLELMEQLISSTSASSLVMVGKATRIHQILKIENEAPEILPQHTQATSDFYQGSVPSEMAMERVLIDDLKELVKSISKIDTSKLETDVALADYGFDSVSLLNLADSMTACFKVEINPTMFFSHANLFKISRFLIENHKEALQKKYDRQIVQELSNQHLNKPVSIEEKAAIPKQEANLMEASLANEPIAIIGMSGRFPGADTKEDFWNNIQAGKNTITEIPLNRWDVHEYYETENNSTGKSNCKWGGFISGVDQFDSLFFNISPKEARCMDPKQRIFLEEAWHALEDAGYTGSKIKGSKCGVFVGVEESEHGFFKDEKNNVISNQNAILSARIAYLLDLKGPNMSLTAACSSGLVALHQACSALRNAECDAALVAGVNLLLSPSIYQGLGKVGMLSTDGKCSVFDQEATGIVPAESVAVLLLKPLSKAIKDGDSIYASIKASGVNYDGKTNGLTSPDPVSQAELMGSMYEKYNINPETIGMVMTHSTGSKFGDPLEIQALSAAFKNKTTKTNFCSLSSVKPLVGHTFAASGIVSLIATVLAIKNRTIPGVSHQFLNEYIQLKDTPFNLNTRNIEWQVAENQPRIAVVSTSGISGTNAHAVIEEYVPAADTLIAKTLPVLIILSAKTSDQLKATAQRLQAYISEHREVSIEDLAFTLQTGREEMEIRIAFEVSSTEECLKELNLFLQNNAASHEYQDSLYTQNQAKLISTTSLGDLAKQWVMGAAVDWSSLYNTQPKILHLPGYPFSTETYPVPLGTGFASRLAKGIKETLHPLLHQNCSTLHEQRFTTSLNSTDFFLSEHKIKGRGVLPAVAYLEMARVAAIESLPHLKDTTSYRLQIKNAVWARPAEVKKEKLLLTTEINQNDKGEIYFEIKSKSDEDNSWVVNSQGNISIQENNAIITDFKAVFERLSPSSVPVSFYYTTYAKMGIEYGDVYRLMNEVYLAPNEVLAKLVLPPHLEYTLQEYSIHPGLMDAALHASIGLMNLDGDHQVTLTLPFALDEVEISKKCTPHMWSWIRYVDPNSNKGNIKKLNVDLYDDAGEICIRVKGLSIREVDKMISVQSNTSEIQSVQVNESPLTQNNPEGKLDKVLMKKTILFLKEQISNVIDVPVNRIDAAMPMEKYGIDSVMVMELTKELERTFGSLPKTLFFEYQTIAELAVHFVEAFPELMQQVTGYSADTTAPAVTRIVEIRNSNIPYTSKKVVRSENNGNSEEDIAVIGLAGKYPGAENTDLFWQNLKEGKDSITEVPINRWNHSLYYDKDKEAKNKTYAKWGGFIESVDEFDPLFFNIVPIEAEMMDPQERLFMQCVYHTLEDAGYTRQSISKKYNGNVGVFAASMYSEYQLYGISETLQGRPLVLPGNASSIANRISYFCNFTGPSLTIDTMCSSSLTALHLACQSIRQGDCQLAIAGGVNVSIHPNKYFILGQARFASSKGRCETFGKDGDGYVPGEGVGAVLLKPLSQAIADKDQIYGVIKATAINHGGKTNGYTVPNPKAQAAVIKKAIERSGIDPRTINYIEAHGTGTSLGDPIEIAALTMILKEYTTDYQYCSIGSVKTNIGHCESAAGIAGLTKVLLQLKHKQLVPSLHSKIANPNIDFSQTPFHVQQELEDWKSTRTEKNGTAQILPRRAGLSAFGAGGSNGHVIIEEYIPPVNERSDLATEPVLIVLSAKNTKQLKKNVEKLLLAIKAGLIKEDELVSMAYTLQTGREEMEERLGILAKTLSELEVQLVAFCKDDKAANQVYTGHVQFRKEMETLLDKEELNDLIVKWIGQKEYEKVLKMWLKGAWVDWESLYRNERPYKMSLPGYSFATERYWKPENTLYHKIEDVKEKGSQSLELHPLLHTNISDFYSVKFTSSFTGKEFFLADHVVNDTIILPGVAYLEMVLAGLNQAFSLEKDESPLVCFSNVSWLRPLVIEEGGRETYLELSENEDDVVSFEITGNNEADKVLHVQGKVTIYEPEAPVILDLEQLKTICNKSSIDGATCYTAYQNLGVKYGPAYQAIERVYKGENQLLVKLKLPSFLKESINEFALHPCMVDAAVHASLAFTLNESLSSTRTGALLFGMDKMKIHGSCSEEMWATVKFSKNSKIEDKVQKLDIEICTSEGLLCVSMHGFSSRSLNNNEGAKLDAGHSSVTTIEEPSPLSGEPRLLKPMLEKSRISEGTLYPEEDKQVLIVGGADEIQGVVKAQYPLAKTLNIRVDAEMDEMLAELKKIEKIDHIVWLTPENYQDLTAQDSIIKTQKRIVMSFFRMIKALLALNYGTSELGWTILTAKAYALLKNEELNPAHASLHGLIGSLAKEYPNWKIRLIDLAKTTELPPGNLFTLPVNAMGDAWVYRHKQWYQPNLIPIEPQSQSENRYKTNGVYVVIGGAGGLGEVWTSYLIKHFQAQVIWIGRRQEDEQIRQKCENLSVHGKAPIYISADATNIDALQKAYEKIKAQYETINGVIHSAVGSLDRSLAKMEEDLFSEGLSANVDISVHIAQVFGKEKLDFVLFFSSIGSFGKALGQSSYAAGCTFKDSFAIKLANEWTCPVKVMNWGYWGNIGVGGVVPEAFKTRLARSGIGTIEPNEAMAALDTLIMSPLNQLALIKVISPANSGT
ncbi:SDR family NAD(P)-dependent oxidoreductase [Chryseobacterium sp. c4a]|uniref:SDR family NAD(P)-dependent oxidoreductase n=1 Tax=Chryseobacterium sp. c4a TaxID=1573582 RepID=UPI00135C908A|nr:SDR family NAD(P)-dependent oxidoreductase [Chryseobacterium sp. c4a]